MELSEEKNDAPEVNEAEIVLDFAFPPRGDAPPALEPGEEPFDLPASFIAAKLAPILVAPAVALAWRDEVDSSLNEEPLLQRRSVPSFVGDQSSRQVLHESSVESSVGEHTVVSVSCCKIDREWKTIAVCQRHEFCRLAGATFTDAGPPFFAGM